MRQMDIAGVSADEVEASYQLSLFKKHFMVMNALYALQTELAVENIYLHITALSIGISHTDAGSADTCLTDHVNIKLREYYLDWRNYEETGEDEVQRLLTGFWMRYAATDKKQMALQALGLEENTDWPMIRDCYRRLAGQHHPDKGGDERKFIEIREAYEILRCSYGFT